MTKMIIDNKANAKKSYEVYEIDRNVYPTIEDLNEIVDECMNNETYSITVYENNKEIIKKYNRD